MRLIKMLGLAALAAISAMAFLGASTASADLEHIVLCEKLELTCESPFSEPTIVAHSTNAVLATSSVTVLCEESLAEVTVLNELGTSITGHILELSFSKCHTTSETACTVTVLDKGELLFEKSGPLTATVTGKGLDLGEAGVMLTEANVKCGFFINCTYSDAGEPELTAHSSEGGETKLLAEETVLAEGKGFLCPEKSTWTADYTALGTMWIES